MKKSEYFKVKNNKKSYKFKYYTTYILGILTLITLLIIGLIIKNPWIKLLDFFILFTFPYYYSRIFRNNFIYKEFVCVEKFKVIEGVEICNYMDLILNRLEVSKYRVTQVNDMFYKANKKSRNYAIYYVDELCDFDIKKHYSLSKKYKFRISTKHSFEDYNLVNIIIANHFDNEIIEFFHYDGYNFYPHKEIFIGIDLSHGIVYMNYGNNNVKDTFSKELYEIVTGLSI